MSVTVWADNTNESVTKSLEIALSEFGSILKDDERMQLQQIKSVPDAFAALVFTANLDAANSTRRGKSIGARAYSMLQSIQQFSAIVETFISAHPDIAALVWGSVKLTLLIAVNITSYFESLADLFMSLNKLFPQYDEYQLLFPNSPELRKSICIFHASIVQLCKEFILLTRQPWVRKVTTDLHGKLRRQIENIRSCANDVKKAISLAKATSDRREQEFQEQERKLATKHRKQFSIFVSQSQKEFERNREWQLQRDLDRSRKHKTKLLNILSTYKHQENFYQTRKKRHINTATWLFSTPEFIKWKDSETPSVFILTGKLGSGKTVLASSVIDYLHCERTRTDELITYVFPRFDDSISLRAATVLRSIIRQFLKPDDVTGDVERQLSRFQAFFSDMDIIKILMQHCVSRFSTLYIVIDALDEFEKEERKILLESLSSVISVSNSKIKLFLVSRISVSKDIRRWFPASQETYTDLYKVQADIEIYAREIINAKQGEELMVEERLNLQDPALAQEIVEALVKDADGMFLWVDYQIAEVCECTCDDEIREVLMTLPKTLGETFDRAAKRIVKRGPAFIKAASSVFEWVAATKRALTLDELREALSYKPGTPYSILGKRPNGLERLTAWCENLIQLDEESQIVQFAHRSVLQHFLGQSKDSSLESFHIHLEQADHFIGEICVTYLNSNEFKTGLIRKPGAMPTQLPNHIVEKVLEGNRIRSHIMRMAQGLDARIHHRSTNKNGSIIVIKNNLEDPMTITKLEHPYLEYALDYWLLHTRKFEKSKSKTWNIWKEMIRGTHDIAKTPWSVADFNKRATVILEWIDKHDHCPLFQQFLYNTKLSYKEEIDLICRYAMLGRPDYIQILIDLIENREQLSYGLPYAAGGGHLDVVQKLLDFKADVNATAGSNGRTALQAAAEGGHLEIVQKLLDFKADVNATAAGSNGRTALQAAAEGGHLEVVQKLLDFKADVNAAAGWNGLTALQAAARGGHLEIVQKLLDFKADVNAVAVAESNGRTALQAAAEGGYLEVVQKLLDFKADVNATAAGSNGRTALQAASEGGHLKVVQKLLDFKADVNAVAAAGWNGRTALQAAARGGHLEIVQKLLDYKADVNATAGWNGLTALQAAAEGGHLKVVQKLLDFKADVNAVAAAGWNGRTALQAAARGGHLEVVQKLLDFKADVNAVAESNGRTALQAASEGGHLEVVQKLLDFKADVNATAAGWNGRTALQAASEGGHLKVVQKLLDFKADVNAVTVAESNGRTALQAAAEGGHLEIVQKLLDFKADVNATAGWNGRTALQAASEGGYLEVVQKLLDFKADVNAVAAAGWNGRTALQAAAEGGYLEVVQKLLDFKADVNAVTVAESNGRTALQAAAEGGYLEVVQKLLDFKADVNATAGWNGRTALQAAAEGGHLEVVVLLQSFNART
ncbi:hypothetical protein OCU04_008663 [Sclerotinia nivalis]|uniref:NACHT domain-containing protein n=1 Tax=Sclerotinia nivalis TaxID=352851 RepID=A0A9X0AII7_9HELO|nr:hypothetical protein OCU04_013253 [Sclerotinia nivalis]KAJ8063447.1 hypothetical protein OCU04_008663 [Sclerotinia nivalis]